jgi:hypothetical protein
VIQVDQKDSMNKNVTRKVVIKAIHKHHNQTDMSELSAERKDRNTFRFHTNSENFHRSMLTLHFYIQLFFFLCVQTELNHCENWNLCSISWKDFNQLGILYPCLLSL